MHTELFELVKDKNVVVVGGADEAISESMIAKADLVVRINSHWKRQKGRCDVIYFSGASDLDYDMFSDLSFLSNLKFAMLNLSQTLFGSAAGFRTNLVVECLTKHNIPYSSYYHAPAKAWEVFDVLRGIKSWSRDVAEKYDFHPLTGILAIYHLLSSPAKSVAVTGMTLYLQCNKTLPTTMGCHDIKSQLRFFRDVVNNPRLKIDPQFEEILQNGITNLIMDEIIYDEDPSFDKKNCLPFQN